jgi:tetratricopeptide (TPR) repeat protein
LIYLKDFAGALENYLKVFELNPTHNRIAHKYLIESLHNLKDDKNIFNYYSRIFNIFEKIVNDAVAQLEKNSSELKPIDYQLKTDISEFGQLLQVLAINCAQLYEKKAETKKAGAILEKMVQFEPKIIAYRRRARYYRENERLEEAEKDEIIAAELIIAELDEWLKRYGGLPNAFEKLFQRGDLYVRIKQFDKAIADYEKAMTLNRYFKETAERKIEAAIEKMQESANQSK